MGRGAVARGLGPGSGGPRARAARSPCLSCGPRPDPTTSCAVRSRRCSRRRTTSPVYVFDGIVRIAGRGESRPLVLPRRQPTRSLHSTGPALVGSETTRCSGRLPAAAWAIVFRARQVSLNRLVASQDGRRRRAGIAAARWSAFTPRLKAAANLAHPNIVPIYEIGEHEGQHYFSMRLSRAAASSRSIADLCPA